MNEELEQEVERLNNDFTTLKLLQHKHLEEIERLNNIINELEKWLNEEYDATIFDYHNAIEDVLDKLRELKGSDKEC